MDNFSFPIASNTDERGAIYVGDPVVYSDGNDEFKATDAAAEQVIVSGAADGLHNGIAPVPNPAVRARKFRDLSPERQAVIKKALMAEACRIQREIDHDLPRLYFLNLCLQVSSLFLKLRINLLGYLSKRVLR